MYLVEEAEIIRKRFEGRGQKVLLSGEKMGVTPKGFDLNISPLDVKKSVVQGKIIVYCSTNLTRNMEAEFQKPCSRKASGSSSTEGT